MSRKKTTADFVHLHNHSQYSLLDGASRIEDMVSLAASYGMPALALTDHGNLFGAVEFHKKARAAGVRPIIGCEVYVAPGDRRERRVHADIPEASFHLTLLCRDRTGYHNLIRLASLAYLEGFYYRPRIDKSLLGEYAGGLIGLSGCLKGEVNYHLRRGDTERAMQAAARYQEILGPENFYLEVMRSGWPEQEKVIPGIAEVSASLGIPMVATNDCHYLRREDAEAHDALICIQTGKKLADSNRLRMTSNELFFRSPSEMAKTFSDMPEAVALTRQVAERCDAELDFDHVQFQLPRFDSPPGFDGAFGYLSHLAREGLSRRYPKPTPQVEERLGHELRVIGDMGFAGYFLVIKDIVDFARSRGIPVGPGRGSAAGCLVLYCLGVTDIDPLRYGLLFERFLNTERVSLPDVDIDFADARRQEVIDYVREKYGDDSVAQIITFGTMQARAVVRDVGRVLEIPVYEVDRMAKLIPQQMKLEQALTTSVELKEMVEAKPEYRKMMTIARKLEGLNRHASIHASAVVIAPKPLIELVPIYRSADGDICTQFDMYSLDAVGLLKMDVLGLRTLTVVEEAGKFIRASGREFDPNDLPLDDARTCQLLGRGETVGVFQLESSGMRDLCRRMQPESVEHITALIALYRPGPMELIPSYLARREGREPIEYEHELLEPICRETYGIMIYQEQVMQAGQALAGYTLGAADLLRRAMGKKKPKEMAALRGTFVRGCAETNGIERSKAERIFDLLAKFAGYGFNKSHAAGYAYLSYVTAYLKANFPVEFIAATLTSELGDHKKVAKFVNEARRMGHEVAGPDVNKSLATFSIERDRVVFGLAGIRNVGRGVSEAIVEERTRNGPYADLLDFLVRNKGVVNRKAVESLIMAGAFDWADPNRTALLLGLELEMAKANSEKLRFEERQVGLFEDSPKTPRAEQDVRFDSRQLLNYEKQAFGFYFSSHPLESVLAQYRALKLVASGVLEDREDGDPVAFGGVITARRVRRDRRDREYVVVTVEDFDGPVEVMVFSGQLEECRQHLQVDTLVVVQGRVRKREKGMAQVWADHVVPFSDAHRYLRAVAIALSRDADKSLLSEVRELLATRPGNCTVFLNMRHPEGKGTRLVRLKEHKVALTADFVAGLERLVGRDAVKLYGELPSQVATGRGRRLARSDRAASRTT